MKFWLVAAAVAALVAALCAWLLELPWATLLVVPVMLVACAAHAARDRYLGRRPPR